MQPTPINATNSSLSTSEMHLEPIVNFQSDFNAVVKRSRDVAEGMSKGVQFLMKKNKIDVILGYGTLKPGKKVDVDGKEYSADHIIIATGGGVILSLENRDLMKVSAIVIYLSSSIEQILRRTSKSKTRPLLERSKDRRKTISDIIEAREGFYQDVASVTINTNGKKLTEVIEEIVNNIET